MKSHNGLYTNSNLSSYVYDLFCSDTTDVIVSINYKRFHI